MLARVLPEFPESKERLARRANSLHNLGELKVGLYITRRAGPVCSAYRMMRILANQESSTGAIARMCA
jgi:hypothetical protein